MTAVLYSPLDNKIYEWNGWELKTRTYKNSGKLTDDDGARYSLYVTSCYGSYRETGFILIGQLE